MNEEKALTGAEIAEVLLVVLTIKWINKVVPGDTYDCEVVGEGGGKKTKFSIPKARIITVFLWIIGRTEGFSIPLLVNFYHGEAVAIGLFLDRFSHGGGLNSDLDRLIRAGYQMPSINAGWHNGPGPGNCFLMISNLDHSNGMFGRDYNGVAVINIYGKKLSSPEQDVLLDNIAPVTLPVPPDNSLTS